MDDPTHRYEEVLNMVLNQLNLHWLMNDNTVLNSKDSFAVFVEITIIYSTRTAWNLYSTLFPHTNSLQLIRKLWINDLKCVSVY